MLRHILSQSKPLGASASALSHRMAPSRSQFTTQAYLDEREGLFKYTRGRWLFNEREREYSSTSACVPRTAYNTENDIRYTPFDHEQLARVACEAMNAHRCTLIEKYEEGKSYCSRRPLCAFIDDSQDLTTRLSA